MVTKQEAQAAIEMLKAVAKTIQELGSVPSGHLYSVLMSRVSLDTYNKIVNMLKKMKVIKEENHSLIWISTIN